MDKGVEYANRNFINRCFCLFVEEMTEQNIFHVNIRKKYLAKLLGHLGVDFHQNEYIVYEDHLGFETGRIQCDFYLPKHNLVIEFTSTFAYNQPMKGVRNLTSKLQEKGIELLLIPPARKSYQGSSKPEMRLYQFRNHIVRKLNNPDN